MVQVSPDWLGNYEGGKTGAEIGRFLLHRIPGVTCNRNLLGLVHRKPLASPGVKDTATAMGTAPGAGYFQRGSLFWFTIITVSFTYYTVMPASGRHGSRSRTGKPAGPALPAWTRVGSRSCPTTWCLGLSRWWWRSRRPAGTPLHTFVHPDPGPRWSPSWGWATSR